MSRRTSQENGYHVNHLKGLTSVVSLFTDGGHEAQNAFILTGAPGTGKTSFAKYVYDKLNSIHPGEVAIVWYQFHQWSTAVNLLYGVNIEAVVSRQGDVIQPGSLTIAAELSRQGKYVVLLLDEIDKAPPSVDALMLTFLQEFFVIDQAGHRLQGDPSKIITFIISNGTRDISEPLMRRCFRYKMPFMPSELETRILVENLPPNAPGSEAIRRTSLAAALVSLANKMRGNPSASQPSLSELIRAQEIMIANRASGQYDDLLMKMWLYGCLSRDDSNITDQSIIDESVSMIQTALGETLKLYLNEN